MEWWKECPNNHTSGVALYLNCKAAGCPGKVLRYPHFFEAVFFECEIINCNKGTITFSSGRSEPHKLCKGTGYLIHPVKDFWWLAPEKLEAEGMSFVLDFTAGWLAVSGHRVEIGQKHPVCALVEALGKVLMKKTI